MPSSDESYDPIPELISNREQMEYFWNLRQENILPLETAWNEGRFYGLLLKGNSPFTAFQRFGIFVIGLLAINVPLVTLLTSGPESSIFGPSLRSLSANLPYIPVVWVPQLLVSLVAGLRFCWVALTPFRWRD